MKKKLTTYLTLVCFLFISSANAQQKVRVEKDLLGEKQVPAEAYYGAQTARALENFKLSGLLINHYPGFVEARAIVKLAAARANTQVGSMKVLESQRLLYSTSGVLRTKYIDGITLNERVLQRYVETTVGIVTALNPVLGYEKATELAGEAYKSGKGVLEIIHEKNLLTEAQIKELLDPVKLTGLDRGNYPKKP